MKKLIVILLMTLAIVGCGGKTTNPVTPIIDNVKDSIITAIQVFNSTMIGQTWTFVNGYGDHTFIAIEAAPFCVFNICDGKTITMHFTKDNIRAYWDPGHDSVLWFYLHLDSDGAYRAIGWEMIQDGVSTSSNVTLLTGWTGAPYTIVPASSNAPAINTAYLGSLQNGLTTNPTMNPVSTWTSTWTTYTGVENVTTPLTGTVSSLLSKQCEGGTSGGCDLVVEYWHFCPNIGLCAINPIGGLTGPVDPKIAIFRIK